MNILEAFHFIFEADASNLKTGLKSANDDNEKLKKGVEQTDQAALKLGETFLSVAKSAATLFAGVVSVGALTAMSAEIAEQTNALDTQAKQLNVNTSSLYDWQNAVIVSGGTADGFNSTLGNLLKSTRDPERALLRMSDTFKQLSSYRALKLGEAMGIDAGTAELLRKGRDGVKDLLTQQRELGTVDTRLIEVSAKYRDSLRDTNRVYDDIKRQIAMVILPIMTKWLDILKGGLMWMRDNKPFVIGFFGAIAGIITAVYLPAMLRAVAATYALLAPYLLVGAAVAAVAAAIGLLVDDIWNFLEGNDSLIGELSKTWPWIGQLVRDTADELKYLWDVAKGLWAFLKLLFTDPAAAWEQFKNELSGGIDALVNRFPALKGPIEELKNAFELCAKGVGAAWEVVIKVLDNVLGMVNTVLGGIGKAFDYLKSWWDDAEEKGAGVQQKIASGEKKLNPGQQGAPEQPNESNGYGSGLRTSKPTDTPTPANTGAGVVNPWAGDPSGRGVAQQQEVSSKQAESDAPVSHSTANDNSVTHNVQNVHNVAQTSTETHTATPNVEVSAAPVSVEAPTVNVTTPAPLIPQPPERQSPISLAAPAPKRKEHTPAKPDNMPKQMTDKGRQDMTVIMGKAKQDVAQMSNAPINRQNSTAIGYAGRGQLSKKTEINIDNIEIQTQAQDADGISRELEGSLQRQFANASSDFDDGYLT